MPTGGVTPGGGGGPAAGSYLPVGAPAGATLDTTTYNNTITGSGKLSTLVFAADTVALAIAILGDLFPRWLFTANPANNGLFMFDGTADARTDGPQIYVTHSGELHLVSGAANLISLQAPTQVSGANGPLQAPRISQVSPLFTITSGALPTVTLSSGTGAQVGLFRDVETVTPVTFNPGAATTATCKAELSPDDVTYSTLGTETEPAGVAFDGTIHLVKVRVPAGWYVKLTVTNATLGTTTYY